MDESNARRVSGAEAVVHVLEKQGVDHVFGLCGHTIIAVLDALEPSPIRFVAVHHEQMAAHAADGLARRTGKPGVLLVHLGPGLTNAITGIANAMLDAIPMVIISGNIQSYYFGRHAHMEVNLHGDANQAEGLAPFCKRVWRVEQPDRLVPVLDAAFRHAQSGRKGPVLVDVAMDAFSLPTDFNRNYEATSLPEPPGLGPDVAGRIVELVAQAKAPVLHLGGGVVASDASGSARRLAETLGLPVTYELLGKGAVPDDHPLNLGMAGFWGTPGANQACRDADVLVSVGTKFGELDTSSWRQGVTFSIPPTELVHIHSDPDEIGRSYDPVIGAVADPARALEALAAAAEGRKPRSNGAPEHLASLNEEFRQAHEDARRSDQVPLRPERVLADIGDVLGEDGVLVGDTGWNKNGVGQQLPISRPGQFIPPGGYATMGFGPAAALGVTLDPSAGPVVALVGDGAFLANTSVVLSAVEEELPVTWVVMNNSSYATITGLQRKTFDSDYGTLFDTSVMDLAAIAEGFGARGVRIKAADQFREELERGMAHDGPVVIDVPTTADNVPTTGSWDINDLFQQGLERTRGDE